MEPGDVEGVESEGEDEEAVGTSQRGGPEWLRTVAVDGVPPQAGLRDIHRWLAEHGAGAGLELVHWVDRSGGTAAVVFDSPEAATRGHAALDGRALLGAPAATRLLATDTGG